MLAEQRKPRVRIFLSLEQRLDILRQLDDGVSVNQLMKDYGISEATVRRTRAQADLFRKQSEKPGFKGRKRFTKYKFKDLDNCLYAWYQDKKAIDDNVTAAILREKAMVLNKELGGPSTFSASNGWMSRFKRRHGIFFRDFSSESANVGTKATLQFTQSFLQRLKEKGIEMQNVYSMDETGLVWKALPRKTLIDPLARRVYGKRIKKSRVTVGLCANATGTHKLPPLFVHRCETPVALKHCRDHLPVIFKAQKNACVNQKVFVDWLDNNFRPAVKRHQLENGTYGKVLLLINKCKAHLLQPETQTKDDSIEFLYLPSVTSSSLHPMQQGIMKNVKVSFRRRILSRILDFPGGVAEFCTDYDVKDCIDLVAEAWADVTQVDIYNSWKKLVRFGATVEEDAEKQSEEHFADKSDITTIKDIIKGIINETVSDKPIEKWLSICERAENDKHDLEIEEENGSAERPFQRRDEDEIDRKIAKLMLWSETQSDFVKLHARLVKDYYDLVQR